MAKRERQIAHVVKKGRKPRRQDTEENFEFVKQAKIKKNKLTPQQAFDHMTCLNCKQDRHDECDRLEMPFCACRREDHDEMF